MPKKYTPQLDDYMMFAAVSSMYQMFRPIEEKLRAAGYTGVLFSDYDSMINNQCNENWPDTDFRARRLYAEQNGLSDTPSMAMDAGFARIKPLTKRSLPIISA